MSLEKIPITPQGFKRLQEELKRLKNVERPKAIEAIAEARGHGDLSENAEYDAAKERQGMLEARIRELDDQLARSRIIDPSTLNSDKVVFGAIVKLLDLGTELKVSYQLVGDPESDLKEGRISISSPIGKALVGKSVGDVVEVHTPRGVRELEILEIRFE